VWTRLSDDGERLLLGASPGEGAELSVWSVATRRRLCSVNLDRTLAGTAFLPDGSVALWLGEHEGAGEGLACRWDTSAQRIDRWIPPAIGLAWASELSTGGGRALFWGRGSPRVVDLGSRLVTATLPPSRAVMTAAALSPDGRWIATGDWGGELRLFDAERGALLARFGTTTCGSAWVDTPRGQRFRPGPWVTPR
jgi:hypothetical protein